MIRREPTMDYVPQVKASLSTVHWHIRESMNGTETEVDARLSQLLQCMLVFIPIEFDPAIEAEELI